MAAEIQVFLDYIKSMGIEAWIPDTPGHGSKMSVSDQCRSKVLCLKYKGTDIYIKGNTCLTMNAKSTESHKNNKPVELKNNTADGSKGDSNNVYYKICNKISQTCNLVYSENLAGKCGCNSEIKTLPGIPEEHLKHPAECLIKTINCVENAYCLQKKFSSEMGGTQFKRIVCEKLTREVRVAKCYVSSLPSRIDDTEKILGGKDYENPTEFKKHSARRGFVRQLIKLFNADD